MASELDERYAPKGIEGKWQQVWAERKTFKAPNPNADPLKRPKYYTLCMFPYPSGAIHMGHLRNYTIGDIVARYKRMQGFNVLQPVGWDAFGLPAENAAIQRGVHPGDWTIQNIAQMRTELKLMGIAYDWDREVATCLPEYFRWEQMFFERFYREGLAYKKTGTVNWCNSCQTVLANEQVQDGKCWRCDGPVVAKELNQWYLKITLYADQLLEGHKQLEGKWPERVLDMQRNWIGKSHGSRIQFALEGRDESLEVFTTRPDTLFGVTFVTIAPHHPLADSLCTTSEAKQTVQRLKKEVSARARDAEPDGKQGVATGSFARHPLTGEKVPVWVGDFVVMDYGTGAVMGVPAHDERDFEFATQYKLPIKQVIVAKGETPGTLEKAYTDAGVLVASGDFTGFESETAKVKIGEKLESEKKGIRTIQYRLRDWGISRQRYWGAPVPVIYCDTCGVVLVPEKDLPVELPRDVQFTGVGNPLERHEGFKNVACPQCKGKARRETDTMDTFVESSWYYARYTDPKNDKAPFDKAAADQWLPVDFYIGGIEHACMHLLYSRFFHKVLRDWGYLSGDEPFSRLLSQGMVVKDGAKMSKSKGNVVSPVAIIDKYGADTGRLFSLFAAPPEKDLDWNEKGVEGCFRFIQRLWRLFYQFREVMASPAPQAPSAALGPKLLTVRRKTHWMIAKMNSDITENKFNVAISAAMELVNEVYGALTENAQAFDSDAGRFVIQEALRSLVLCLSPFTPHLSEELWASTGSQTMACEMPFPKALPEFLSSESFVLVVQVNGKVRDKVEVRKGMSKDEIQAFVLALPKVQQFMEGKPVRQFVYVPERIANVVLGN
jgi:leucyl-tRNA synthetase